MRNIAENVEITNAETAKKTEDEIRNELRNDLADWMTTNEDLVCRPAIELTKEGNEFAARTLVPDVDAKDVEVMVAPDVMMIKGIMHHGKSEPRKVLSSVRFPRPVNPDHVHAKMRDGMLSVRAEIAGANVRMFPVAA